MTVTDKRRIDPQTGEIRETASAPAPSGPEPGVISDASQDQAAELIADLQRVQADFSNYRKRSLRDQQVATERASLGASQSRLELAASTLQIEYENLEAAISRIRDVDVAEESTQYAKYNILVQSGTAMLAQANQTPKAVLQLLQQ